MEFYYSPFCVQAKIIKLVGLKNGGRLSPINLVTLTTKHQKGIPSEQLRNRFIPN